MPHVSTFALQLIDPRGRCNRRGLLLAAVLVLALQAAVGSAMLAVGIGLTGHAGLTVHAVFGWLGFALVSKRLHDLGHSTWWVPTALLIWLAAAVTFGVAIILLGDPEILTHGTLTYWLAFGAVAAPLVVCATWLLVAEGEAAANRSGPVPTAALGFAMPADAGQWPRQPQQTGPTAA